MTIHRKFGLTQTLVTRQSLTKVERAFVSTSSVCTISMSGHLHDRFGEGSPLVLVLKKASVPGQYSRIGHFVTDGDIGNQHYPRDDAPDGYYTITLV